MYEIYFTLDGKPHSCKCDLKQDPGVVYERFHKWMQNTKISKEKLEPRYSQTQYKLLAMTRAGKWYDDFHTMPTPDKSGQAFGTDVFTAERPLDTFPERVESI